MLAAHRCLGREPGDPGRGPDPAWAEPLATDHVGSQRRPRTVHVRNSPGPFLRAQGGRPASDRPRPGRRRTRSPDRPSPARSQGRLVTPVAEAHHAVAPRTGRRPIRPPLGGRSSRWPTGRPGSRPRPVDVPSPSTDLPAPSTSRRLARTTVSCRRSEVQAVDYDSRYSLPGVRRATTAPQEALIARATEVFAGRRPGARRLPGGRLRRRERRCLERRRPAVRGQRRRRGGPAAGRGRPSSRQSPPPPTSSPSASRLGGVCITPEWLHFDLVLRAGVPGRPEDRRGHGAPGRQGRAAARVDPVRPPQPPGRAVLPRPARSSTSCTCSATWSRSSGATRSSRPPTGSSSSATSTSSGCSWPSRAGSTTREHAFGNPFPFTKRLREYLTEEQHRSLT